MNAGPRPPSGERHAMRLRQVPAARGARWVRDGAVAVLRFPIAFASLFATGLFGMMVAGFIPFVGELIFLLLLPAGALVFMVASRLAAEGTVPVPFAFLAVLRAPRVERIALLKLGIGTAVAVLAAMLLAHLLDHGVLWNFIARLAELQSQPGSVPPASVDPRVQLSVLLQMALLLVVSIPFWHAPALVHWGGYGWLPSMFFSTVAFWRNKAAFAVYGATWLAVWVAFSLVLTAGAALLGPVVAAFLLVPMLLFGGTLFFATRYFSFADCFERSTHEPAKGA